MNFQSFVGLVLYETVSRSCFHFVCCSCLISSSISLFRDCMRERVSGVGSCLRREFRTFILCFMFLLKVGLYCFMVPVGMCCLLALLMLSLKYCTA